ncbi:MAG: hypothetical protein VX475_11465, partial [Myxococcota bacterium]|nr:hypothetical protein [Myxococcota bacterium]
MAEALELLEPNEIDLSHVVRAARPISGQKTVAIADIAAPTVQVGAAAIADTIAMNADSVAMHTELAATETISVQPPLVKAPDPKTEPELIETKKAGL